MQCRYQKRISEFILRSTFVLYKYRLTNNMKRLTYSASLQSPDILIMERANGFVENNCVHKSSIRGSPSRSVFQSCPFHLKMDTNDTFMFNFEQQDKNNFCYLGKYKICLYSLRNRRKARQSSFFSFIFLHCTHIVYRRHVVLHSVLGYSDCILFQPRIH